MAEQHALRVARGARRVAEAGGGVLVELGPVEIVGLRGEQLFVAEEIRAASTAGMCARSVSAIQVVTLAAMRRELFDERQEREIEEDQAVLGVVDDVGELVEEKARD